MCAVYGGCILDASKRLSAPCVPGSAQSTFQVLLCFAFKKSTFLGGGAAGFFSLRSVQEVFYGDDCHIDVAEHGGGEDDELVLAAEARMRVNVIVGADVVGAFRVVGDQQVVAGVAIEEMDG